MSTLVDRLLDCAGAIRRWTWLDVVSARLWSGAFVYATVAAVVMQFILPRLFPSWIYPSTGIIIGTDTVQFDEFGRLLAGEIVTRGWSIWQLAPDSLLPIGVSSGAYALFWPKFWVLIPLHSVLFATTALVLLKIVVAVVGDSRIAALAVLPFVIFPSSLTWSTQMMRDGFTMLGAVILILGWVCICAMISTRWWSIAATFAVLLVGAAVSARAKPYTVQFAQAGMLVGAMFLIVVTARAVWRREYVAKAVLTFVCAWAAVFAVAPFTTGGRDISPESLPIPLRVEQVAPVSTLPEAPSAAVTLPAPPPSTPEPSATPVAAVTPPPPSPPAAAPPPPSPPAAAPPPAPEPYRQTSYWTASPRLPERVDAAMHAVSRAREGFLVGHPTATSNIDADHRLMNASDFVRYVPRAIQIGFLAPFPRHWIERGSRPASAMARRMSAIEMIAVYISLALLPLALWRFRANFTLWTTLMMCGGNIVVLALAVANLGALHRMRYPYLAVFCSLSLAAGLVALADWHCRRRARESGLQPTVMAIV